MHNQCLVTSGRQIAIRLPMCTRLCRKRHSRLYQVRPGIVQGSNSRRSLFIVSERNVCQPARQLQLERLLDLPRRDVFREWLQTVPSVLGRHILPSAFQYVRDLHPWIILQQQCQHVHLLPCRVVSDRRCPTRRPLLLRVSYRHVFDHHRCC